VLDIIPTAEVWEAANRHFALDFWPWSLLAQAEPLPEKMVSGSVEAVVDDALANWGTPKEIFEPHIRNAYYEAMCDPAHVHAICEEYRAAATIDYQHDLEDRKQDKRIICPVLALWSKYLDTTYGGESGLFSIWRKWADQVTGHCVSAGHFFPEEKPEETAQALLDFFKRQNHPYRPS
jgi:haloacetate dehalogenase